MHLRKLIILWVQVSTQQTGQEKAAAVQFYRAIRARKTIVDHASSKLAVLQRIVIKNISEKILVFGGSNEFTDKLAEATETFSTVYHSGKTKKTKRESVSRF